MVVPLLWLMAAIPHVLGQGVGGQLGQATGEGQIGGQSEQCKLKYFRIYGSGFNNKLQSWQKGVTDAVCHELCVNKPKCIAYFKLDNGDCYLRRNMLTFHNYWQDVSGNGYAVVLRERAKVYPFWGLNFGEETFYSDGWSGCQSKCNKTKSCKYFYHNNANKPYCKFMTDFSAWSYSDESDSDISGMKGCKRSGACSRLDSIKDVRLNGILKNWSRKLKNFLGGYRYPWRMLRLAQKHDSGYAKNAADCENKCQNQKWCKFWTFRKKDKVCFLKVEFQRSHIDETGERDEEYDSGAKGCSLNSLSDCIIPNVDLGGGGQIAEPIHDTEDHKHCERLCKENAECITWVRLVNGVCYLKSDFQYVKYKPGGVYSGILRKRFSYAMPLFGWNFESVDCDRTRVNYKFPYDCSRQCEDLRYCDLWITKSIFNQRSKCLSKITVKGTNNNIKRKSGQYITGGDECPVKPPKN